LTAGGPLDIIGPDAEGITDIPAMNILITGANGFIGCNLCRHFLGRGHRVYAFVRPTSDLRFLEGLGVEIITGDLADAWSIAIPDDVEAVVHAAAVVSDMARDEECDRNIYQATVNLVRRLQEKRPPVRRFIYVSTALVLGLEGTGISEERPGRNLRHLPYTKHKMRAERFVLAEQLERGFPAVILRPGDVYGPYDRTTCAQILRGCEKGVPLIVGSGRRRFAYCWVGNLCRAAELALEKPGVAGRAYTVTNGAVPTWREFFTALQAGLGRRQRVYVPVWFAFTLAALTQAAAKIIPGLKPSLSHYRIRRITTETTFDISRTVAELGYEPDDDYRSQAAEIVRWYLEEKERGRLA
jgi:nucleoside-diphosphate-sugar epimerase